MSREKIQGRIQLEAGRPVKEQPLILSLFTEMSSGCGILIL